MLKHLNEIRPNLISSKATILDAIKLLDTVIPKIVFVTDDLRVMGTITDGDVRRHLLAGINVTESCTKAMREDFKFIQKQDFDNTSNAELSKKFRSLLMVPVLDGQFLISAFVPLTPMMRHESIEKSVAGLIMAGGLGSRMGELTKDTPKAMLRVRGTPMAEILLYKMKEVGIKKVYISTFYLSQRIIDHLGDGNNIGLEIVYLKEHEPLGTAGALRLIKKYDFEDLLVTNCDVLTELNYGNLLEFHTQQMSIATMAVRRHEMSNPFGVVDYDGLNFHGINEKPKYVSHINAGIYVLNKRVLSLIGNKGPLDMTEVFIKLRSLKHEPKVFFLHEGWGDIGTPEDINNANESLKYK